MNCPNCGKYYTSRAAFLACHTGFVDCINHLKVINDQLLEACKDAFYRLEYIDNTYNVGNTRELQGELQAAIAAAKGES